MKNPCLEVALNELAKVGIRDVTHSFGGKHQQIRFKVNGAAERSYTLPSTPSDFRSAANTRSDIRRILREGGVLMPVERKPPTPKQPDRVTIIERRLAIVEQQLAALSNQVVILEQQFAALNKQLNGVSIMMTRGLRSIIELPPCGRGLLARAWPSSRSRLPARLICFA